MFTLTPYFESFHQMETQFEFLRYAFSNLSSKKREDFFKTKRQKELVATDNAIEALSPMLSQNKINDSTIQWMKRAKRRHTDKKWGREIRDLYQAQFVPDDLNKSELLLLVALFDGCLKDLYRELVVAEPGRAFANSEKQEQLKLIFADKSSDWAAKFFQRIADEETERFDRVPFGSRESGKGQKGRKGRIEFLEKSFEIRTNKQDVAAANGLINRRHKISHEWTNRNEVKHVSPKELKEARFVFREIIERLFSQASQRYPNHFTR
jgi:hypothetical protein